jgi:hypothetical protein
MLEMYTAIMMAEDAYKRSTGTGSFTLRMEAVVIFFREFGIEIAVPTRKNGQL